MNISFEDLVSECDRLGIHGLLFQHIHLCPTRTCMETLYLLAGSKISRRDNTIRITPKESKARNFPVESLKHIIVAGTIQFNSELLTFLGKRGVRLSFLDYYGNFAGSLEAARLHASGAVHLASGIDSPQFFQKPYTMSYITIF